MEVGAKGWGSLDSDVKIQEEKRMRAMAQRFFVKDGESRQVVFLDDEPTVVDEYMIQAGSDWKNKEFATKPIGEDHFLKAGLESRKTYIWSIADITRDPKKPDEKREFKKLFAADAKTAKLLYEKSKSWGGMKMKLVKISRNGAKTPAIGSDFELQLVKGAPYIVQPTQMKDPAPFDYTVVLRPPTSDETIRLLAKVRSGGGSDSEAIPFGDAAAHPANGAPAPSSSGAHQTDGGGVDDAAADDIPF